MNKAYNYILNILFPKTCINCKKQGDFICEDCLSLIELNKIQYCACLTNPKKGVINCENCEGKIYTIFNKKQKLAKLLVYKSDILLDLNKHLSYLIIIFLKENNVVINPNHIFYSEELPNLALELNKNLNLKGSQKILIVKNYKKNTKYKLCISLFRDLDYS